LCRGARQEAMPHHGNRPTCVCMEVPHVLEKETGDNRKGSCRQSGEREALAWPHHPGGAQDSNFREVRRVTNLLSKIERQGRDEESSKYSAGGQNVNENTTT